MYTTSQMVQRILVIASDWNVSGERGVLPVINEVNHIMMAGDIDHAIRIDAATGRYPVLATTSGTFQYNCPDDCRKVADVLIEEVDQYSSYDDSFDYQPVKVWGEDFYSIRNVTSRLRSITANATVTFPADPGTTTSRYYLKYWINPTTISSTSIQPDVPPDFHHMLIDGVVARIQPIQYGREDPWQSWLERMKMEFWGAMNYNPPQNLICPRRFC